MPQIPKPRSGRATKELIEVSRIRGSPPHLNKNQRRECPERTGWPSVSHDAERLLGSRTEKTPLDLMIGRLAVTLERDSCGSNCHQLAVRIKRNCF